MAVERLVVTRVEKNWHNYVPELRRYIGQIGVVKDVNNDSKNLQFPDGNTWWVKIAWLTAPNNKAAIAKKGKKKIVKPDDIYVQTRLCGSDKNEPEDFPCFIGMDRSLVGRYPTGTDYRKITTLTAGLSSIRYPEYFIPLTSTCNVCTKLATHYVLTPNFLYNNIEEQRYGGTVPLLSCKEHFRDVYMNFVNTQLQMAEDIVIGRVTKHEGDEVEGNVIYERLRKHDCIEIIRRRKYGKYTKEAILWMKDNFPGKTKKRLSGNMKKDVALLEKWKTAFKKQQIKTIKIPPLTPELLKACYKKLDQISSVRTEIQGFPRK